MNTVKITKRERYESIQALVNAAQAAGIEGFDFEGIVGFCDKEIVALANRAEKAKETAAKKRAEGDALREIVLSVLDSEPAIRQTVYERVMSVEGIDPEVTLSKVGYRLTALVEAGLAVKSEITVEADGKNKKLTAYALA